MQPGSDGFARRWCQCCLAICRGPTASAILAHTWLFGRWRVAMCKFAAVLRCLRHHPRLPRVRRTGCRLRACRVVAFGTGAHARCRRPGQAQLLRRSKPSRPDAAPMRPSWQPLTSGPPRTNFCYGELQRALLRRHRPQSSVGCPVLQERATGSPPAARRGFGRLLF